MDDTYRTLQLPKLSKNAVWNISKVTLKESQVYKKGPNKKDLKDVYVF